MIYFWVKAAISGVLIALISETAKRWPGVGALIASLPLVSVIGMLWLWRDRPDAANMARDGAYWKRPTLSGEATWPKKFSRGLAWVTWD